MNFFQHQSTITNNQYFQCDKVSSLYDTIHVSSQHFRRPMIRSYAKKTASMFTFNASFQYYIIQNCKTDPLNQWFAWTPCINIYNATHQYREDAPIICVAK